MNLVVLNRDSTVESTFKVPSPHLPSFMLSNQCDANNSTMKFGDYEKHVAIVALYE